MLASVSAEQQGRSEESGTGNIKQEEGTGVDMDMHMQGVPTSPINGDVRGGAEVRKKKKQRTGTGTGSGGVRKSGGRARAGAGKYSGGKVFHCRQCSSTFSQQFNLNKHVRAVHEMRRPFECEVCHSKFQQRSHRKMHFLAVHEKLRQYSCDRCNYSFSWRGVLKKHRKSIHGLDD